MHAQHALFQQGYSLLGDVHPYMTQLAAAVRDGATGPAPFATFPPHSFFHLRDLVFSWISW